jgi:hypothetical protein
MINFNILSFYSISKSKMTQRRAVDSFNKRQGEADKASFDLEMD